MSREDICEHPTNDQDPEKEKRWCLHLPLDVVFEQFLVHAVELGAADVVKVVSDVASVLLSAGGIRALEFPVPILVVKVACGTPGRVSTASAICYAGCAARWGQTPPQTAPSTLFLGYLWQVIMGHH